MNCKLKLMKVAVFPAWVAVSMFCSSGSFGETDSEGSNVDQKTKNTTAPSAAHKPKPAGAGAVQNATEAKEKEVSTWRSALELEMKRRFNEFAKAAFRDSDLSVTATYSIGTPSRVIDVVLSKKSGNHLFDTLATQVIRSMKDSPLVAVPRSYEKAVFVGTITFSHTSYIRRLGGSEIESRTPSLEAYLI
jgi:hypothetical protein